MSKHRRYSLSSSNVSSILEGRQWAELHVISACLRWSSLPCWLVDQSSRLCSQIISFYIVLLIYSHQCVLVWCLFPNSYSCPWYVHTDSLSLSLSLCPFKRLFSRWTWVSQYQNVSILDFIIAKGYRGDGNSWSHKPAKLQSKCHTNKPTSKFLQARFPDFYISLHCAVIVSLCPTFSESIHLFSAVFKKFSEVLSHQPALLSRSQSYYTHY